MKNLLYKEFHLVINPLYYLTVLFGALLLIPQWLYFIAMMYFFFFIIPTIFNNAKAMNDVGFTIMLPVRKRDVVKARVLSVATLELIQIAGGAVFTILNMAIYPWGNFAIDANLAYLGCVFIMYGIFNVIFFPLYYRTAYKIGWPITIALTAVFLFAFGVEMLVQFEPTAAYVLDGITREALIRQVPVLVGGIVLGALLTVLGYIRSVKNFEKVDL